MELGVQTHFSQGWNSDLLEKAKALGVREIRDSQPWATVEKAPGVYSFTPGLVNYMDRAEGLGISSLLTFASVNTLYDSGFTPYTAAGRQAYADYIVAVLRKYDGQVEEIEIWNEFNTGNFTGPAGAEDAVYYTALLKTVWETVKPLFPEVKILGGSVNVVGVGALESLFKLGALDYMDGVAIHPYRSTPEHVDDEIAHLRAVMDRYGEVKPIYATEFGNQFTDPAEVPDFMVKMVTLMASAGVAESYWYALVDQSFYANMGLYTTSGETKPAAAAFAFIQSSLLSLGDPVRVDTGDDMTLVYRFGADTYVMWSSGRPVSFGAGTVYNSEGQQITAPAELSMTPVIFKGAGYTLGESLVVADSLMQFGEGDWQYFAKARDGKLTALSNVDWDWTSYLGSKYTKPLRVNADSIAPAGDGANPIQVVERYVSDRDQTLEIDAAWTVGTTGDGVDLHLLVNGVEILSRVFTGTFALDGYRVSLKAGDTLDFAMGPNQYVNGDSTGRRIVLTRVVETFALAAMADMLGGSGADVLTGGAAADRIRGLAGDDRLSGLAGDDLLAGGAGRNIIDGGAGFDIVSYADAASAVRVQLGAAGFQSPNAAAVDRLIGIEGVIGSAFGDTLLGSATGERFLGGGGDDVISPGGGADVIDGGDGRDQVSFAAARAGVTVSLLDAGVQAAWSGQTVQLSSVEAVAGSSYADRLEAGATASTLDGGAGDDVLLGGAGDDLLLGRAGWDTVSYEKAGTGVTVSLAVTAAQATGAGRDTLSGVEALVGSSFADGLTGGTAANSLAGGGGDDVLTGSGGADRLTGGLGADRFVYRVAADSRTGAVDVLTDFSHRQGDRIDLSAIDASVKLAGDNAFVLAAAFTGVAGRLTLTANAEGYLVQGDCNGDRLADLVIQVVTDSPLAASDFIL